MTPRLYALHLGTREVPESKVVQGGGDRPIPLAQYAFVIQSARRTILVDTGFPDQTVADRRGVRDFAPAASALERLDLSPAQVNDVVLTHGHWNNVGGLRDFLHARIWIARDEVLAMQRAVGPEDRERDGYRWEDLQVLGLAPRALTLGRRRQVDPCVRASVVSGHTPGTLAVTILGDGHPRLLLAGDNAFLYRNLEGEPVAPCSRAGGHDALARLRHLAGDALLVPGRDPDLGRHFPEIAPGTVRLYP